MRNLTPTVYVVPCGAQKAIPTGGRAPAGEAYTGPLHRSGLEAAGRLARAGDRIVILSGLYGFLELTDPIADYDVKFGSPGSITPEALRAQARDAGYLTGDRPFVVLGAKAYVDACRAALSPLRVEAPLAGLGGIGYMRGALAKMGQL